ncbi:MAG: transposase [Acidobacteria bacterium]|nr:transposase [Acidobacteriota bacterium]
MLLDHGYPPESFTQELKKIAPQLAARIKLKQAQKVTPEQHRTAQAGNPTKKKFVVIEKRWLVERTNAWINLCRVLRKNCESLLKTSKTKIRLCAIRLLLRRLA